MKIGIAGPGAAAVAREPTCSIVAAPGTATPVPASSPLVPGPAPTTAPPPGVGPVAGRTGTPRPSSATPGTGTPARAAPAAVRRAASALITQDSGSSRAGPPIAS